MKLRLKGYLVLFAFFSFISMLLSIIVNVIFLVGFVPSFLGLLALIDVIRMEPKRSQI